MSTPPDVFSVPFSGAMLGPFPMPGSEELTLQIPAGAASLDLRGLSAVASAEISTGVQLGGAAGIQTVQMPVPGGFWLRAHLPHTTTVETELPLTLTNSPTIRFLHIRPKPARPAPAAPSPRLGQLPDLPVQENMMGAAARIAEQFRAGSTETAMTSLARLPARQMEVLAAELLSSLAEDPGGTPPDLLFFLMLLTRN